jgi:hypothetical protein
MPRRSQQTVQLLGGLPLEIGCAGSELRTLTLGEDGWLPSALMLIAYHNFGIQQGYGVKNGIYFSRSESRFGFWCSQHIFVMV